MRQSVIFLVVASLCVAFVQSEDGGDLDTLIGQVFNNPAGNKPNLNPSQGAGGAGGQKPVYNNNNNNKPNLNPSQGKPAGDKSCKTETGETGECVSYYLCTANNSIIVDGTGIIDIRIEDGPCESYMEVCCLPPDRSPNVIRPPPPAIPKPVGCGIRNPEGVGFRIKGDKDNEAQFGEFPWMVAILREEAVAAGGQKLNVYQCGGALIHPKVVMTAAHCVTKTSAGPPKLKVRVGEWDTQTKNEIFPHQDRNVVKIVSHKDYYPGGLFNDIAILILESPVEEAENVGVVCLPPLGVEAPPGRCLASGWGKDVFGKEGRYQVILKKVELPIVDRNKCKTSLRKTRLGQHFELHKSFICAGGEAGKDTCKGDGGSPLVCPMPGHPDRYMQSGIVAWGIGCGENSTPGVYANVASLREWIDEQLIYNNIDMSAYNL